MSRCVDQILGECRAVKPVLDARICRVDQLICESGVFSSDTFYHGSSHEFGSFEMNMMRTGADAGGKSWYGDGVYLTGIPWKAKMYGNSGYVYLVKCTARNPLVVPGTNAVELTPAVAAGLGISEDAASELAHDSQALTKALLNRGYDCIAVLSDGSLEVNELVAFDDSMCTITSVTTINEFNRINRALRWPVVTYHGKRPPSRGW